MDKIKLLAWGDYCASTGFGSVMSNIMCCLEATGKYDLDVVGINYAGDPYDRERWPGRVWPARSALLQHGPYEDFFGRQRLLDVLGHGQYDVLFMLQDAFIVKDVMPAITDAQRKHPKLFKTVYYYPIDATPVSDWILDTASRVNFPVTYTQYGYEQSVAIDHNLKNKLKVIYHGNNFNDFHYIEDREAVADFRKNALMGCADGKFLVMNVNRNQTRKDIMRSFMVLNELNKRGVKDVIFYFHMYHGDVGGSLEMMAANFPRLKKDRDYIYPDYLNTNSGIPIEVMNYMYNAVDAVITTTHGEGWGLSISEAMATRTPVVAPNHTSLTEMLADNRGYLVRAGWNPSMWIMKDTDNERLRPLMDVEEAADRIEDLIAGKLPDIDAAEDWIRQLTWETVTQQWQEIIDKAASEAQNRQPTRR